MKYLSNNPFDNYFHIEVAKIDKGLLQIEAGERHGFAKAFFDYQHTIDLSHCRSLEVVEVKKSKSVVLPKSVRNRSKVLYAGVKPIFASLDLYNNLIAYILVGSVIRVEYLGSKGVEKRIKYFRCL